MSTKPPEYLITASYPRHCNPPLGYPYWPVDDTPSCAPLDAPLLEAP
ncbi:MAG TPA: hypothetical protein VHI51_09925 [Ktedonobacterales bacterium]|jgi:hypothetical protein|nr:hypothetical protein [Ktedonobacterales bacterium]